VSTALESRTAPRAQRDRTSILVEGALAGLGAAAAVAVWFFVYDLMIGAPFRTPALLGAALFRSAHDWNAVAIRPSIVLQYTMVHVGAFLLLGWTVAGLLALADREPRVRFAAFMLFCCFQVVVLVLIGMLAAWLLEPLAWWLVVGANLAATAVMLWVFSRRHRLSVWRSDTLPPR
jgi:hypothetical protein